MVQLSSSCPHSLVRCAIEPTVVIEQNHTDEGQILFWDETGPIPASEA